MLQSIIIFLCLLIVVVVFVVVVVEYEGMTPCFINRFMNEIMTGWGRD